MQRSAGFEVCMADMLVCGSARRANKLIVIVVDLGLKGLDLCIRHGVLCVAPHVGAF